MAISLQNFVDRVGPVISAAWANMVDLIRFNYNQTAAEILAGVTPLNIGYRPGKLFRYVNPTATDMAPGLLQAISCNKKKTCLSYRRNRRFYLHTKHQTDPMEI